MFSLTTATEVFILMLHQKRSELLRLFVIVALMAVSVGIILVQSAKVDSSPQQSSPIFVNSSVNSSTNFTITVSAGSNTVRYIGINKPASYSDINCADLVPVDSSGNSFVCTEVTTSLVKYTSNDGLTAGNSVGVKINATSGAASGNVSFTINTFEDASGTTAQNNTIVNVTVDDEAPLISSINVTSGTLILTNDTIANGTGRTFVAKNALVINATITSNLAAVNTVILSYNVSNDTVSWDNQSLSLHPTGGANTITMSNTTVIDEANGLFNATIPVSDISNGSVVFFVIVASDTIGNENVTNDTTNYEGISLYTFNLTVDDAAPTALAPTTGGLNNIIDDNFDAVPDNITNSTVLHNFSIVVVDSSGVGVYSVWINVSGTHTLMASRGADNLYNATGTLQGLGASAGDQNLTIYFITNDSVGNQDNSLSINLLVDDPDFAFTVYSNATNNFTTSNNTIINITATINANLNITDATSNVTINGPNNIMHNMTLMTTTTSWGAVGNVISQLFYQSTWFSSVAHTEHLDNASETNGTGTWSNLSDFGCELQGIGDVAGDDGDACSLKITWVDIFGLESSSNITITVDNVAPIVVNLTVSNVTDTSTNFATTDNFVTRASSILNFSVNAYNNVQNVTIHNSTNAAQSTNATVLNSGGETNYSIQLSTDDLCGSAVEGACTVNFSVTDQALNSNTSASTILKLTIDESVPLVGSFAINGTVSSSYSYVPGAFGMVVRSDTELEINTTLTDQQSSVIQANFGNTTLRNMTLTNQDANFTNVSVLSNYGCPAGVETECLLAVQVADNVSLSNNSINLTFIVDDLAPRVANFTTNLTFAHSVTSSGMLINFSVNITDIALPNWNVSIGNTTLLRMNKSDSTTDNSTSVVWWADVSLSAIGCTTDGNCTVHVVANDSAGNVNDSVQISVNLDSSTISTVGMNISPTGTISDNTPTLWINLTTNSICKYATTQVPYEDMTAMGGDGTGQHDFATSALAEGLHTYYFRCADNLVVEPANVFPQSTTFTVDAFADLVINNLTTGATFNTASPNITVNTSDLALCRYSNSGVTNYSDMSSNFDPQGGDRHNAALLSNLLDDDYNNYYVSCINSSTVHTSVANDNVDFTVDTTSLWNITIGATGSNGVRADYFTSANKFYSFTLPNTNVLTTTSLNNNEDTYNVTNVLESIVSANPSGVTSNLSVMFAHNTASNTWTSYIPGDQAGNDFLNFTSDVTTYYFNLSQGNERLEIG